MTVTVAAGRPNRETVPSKRKVSLANASGSNRTRPVKRRASRACCCCRARKVRCDVVEHGSPCTNCRLDQVECVVTESKRRRKSPGDIDETRPSPEPSVETIEDPGLLPLKHRDDSYGYFPDSSEPLDSFSPSSLSVDFDSGQQISHLIYQTEAHQMEVGVYRHHGLAESVLSPNVNLNINEPTTRKGSLDSASKLPGYIRGLPQRLPSEDVEYLTAKGALTIPTVELRNELLKSYIQYVHAYMPLLDLEEFLHIIARHDGTHRTSLLLFQAVMFAGTAFVDIKHLRAAGYSSRKAARKAFFHRARLLYDFDYEIDRIPLVQALLLMTYWYETPDDQKDTWYWMGVCLSLALTIGLHRDPANSGMDVRQKRLWRRIWWCAYTRDRLIALGMRRPMRIKDDDYDVLMLSLDDFEFKAFAPEVMSMVGNCGILRNVNHQKQLALMFIEKAKLCLRIGHVLSTQYSVLSHKFGGMSKTTMVLVPKKSASVAFQVRGCQAELEYWEAKLPAEIQYRPPSARNLCEEDEVLHVHRALLRMVYLTTSSALHRPQVLPAASLQGDAELQGLSRRKVRYAAVELTNIAQDLHTRHLTRYFPTTSITVLLPAMIIHLLDVKSSDLGVRMASLQRFYQCMQILQRLREIYASADFATSFLEAAIRKAGVQFSIPPPTALPPREMHLRAATTNSGPLHRQAALTPPPDSSVPKISDLTYPTMGDGFSIFPSSDDGVLAFEASTPPHSVGSENDSSQTNSSDTRQDAYSLYTRPDMSLNEFIDLANDAEVTQNDFDALINFDHMLNSDPFVAEDDLDTKITNSGHGQ